MATQKLVESLSIKNLKAEFPIARIRLAGCADAQLSNQLQIAIEDGILDARLNESASKYCGGDVYTAVKAMKACIASYRCNWPKQAYAQPEIENLRVDTLSNWLAGYTAPTSRLCHTTLAHQSTGRAKYDISDEEIEDLAGDFTALDSLYNCMSSKLSKDLCQVHADEADYEAKVTLRDRLFTQRDRVRELRAAAKAQQGKSVVLTSKLTDKLTNGKATSLSKAEIDELKKLLHLAK